MVLGRSALRELVRRALYGINAARRVGRKVAQGRPLEESLAAERPNLGAHRKARKQRQAADRATEAAAGLYGDVLGWYLGPNEEHCPVCAAAAGNNYRASNPPARGLPGSVHIHCVCFAGPPIREGRMLG